MAQPDPSPRFTSLADRLVALSVSPEPEDDGDEAFALLEDRLSAIEGSLASLLQHMEELARRQAGQDQHVRERTQEGAAALREATEKLAADTRDSAQAVSAELAEVERRLTQRVDDAAVAVAEVVLRKRTA